MPGTFFLMLSAQRLRYPVNAQGGRTKKTTIKGGKMKPLFEMPELVTLNGNPFNHQLDEEFGPGVACEVGCCTGCYSGCKCGSGSGNKAPDTGISTQ